MWQLLFEIIPKPVVLALLGYGAISWFVTGPLIAERITLQAYYPACLSGTRAEALPETMPAEEMLDELQRSPLFQNPAMKSLGLDRYLDLARRQRQVERRAAIATRMKPADQCRCLIDKAIDQSQASWALYAATLRLIARSQVQRFEGVMAGVEKEGLCHG
jgi:hypothetical protein